MKIAIFSTRAKGLAAALVMLGVLTGCGSILPTPPQRADVYDFGPGVSQPVATDRRAPLPTLAVSEFTAAGVSDGRAAFLYRLQYANAQQLYPYTQARWSQPPAVLMQIAVRDRLSERRLVLMGDKDVDQQLDNGRWPTMLRAEVEEFSQVFTSPQASYGLVRVRASLSEPEKSGDHLLAQRIFVVQRPSATPDAAGGAKALADAANQVASEIATWVEQAGR